MQSVRATKNRLAGVEAAPGHELKASVFPLRVPEQSRRAIQRRIGRVQPQLAEDIRRLQRGVWAAFDQTALRRRPKISADVHTTRKNESNILANTIHDALHQFP